MKVEARAAALALFSVFLQQVVDAAPRLASATPTEIPPFVAKGTFGPPDPFSKTHFAFQYSNGWWQVELTNPNPANGPFLWNCMRIPDGIRHYVVFKNSDLSPPTATACPSAFPPPGISGGMFECWLSLCPDADLPLIDGKRLHRFLNVPTCEPELDGDPRSIGEYHLTYLQPQGAFLSELSVTNNGFWMDLTPRSEFTFVAYSPPFQKGGFPELTYEVLQTTNIDGFTFPSRAVFNSYVPNYSTKTGSVPLNVHVRELIITEIRLLDETGAGRNPPPPVLSAMDYRPSDYNSSGNSLKYLGTTVTNDQWDAVLPQNRTLRVFPAAEALGSEWSREVGRLFDPISSPAEEAPRSEAVPNSVAQRIRSSVVNHWEGPVVAWGQARFHVRSNGRRHLYEVQAQRYNSRTRLKADFAILLADVPPEEGEKRQVQGVGEAATLFYSADRQKMTIWFFQGEHLIWISPLGPGPHPLWDADPSLQHLAKAIQLGRFPTDGSRRLR